MQFKTLFVLVPLAAALSAVAAPAGDHHHEDPSTLTVTDFVPTDISLAPGVASTTSANASGTANTSETSTGASTTDAAVATDLAKRQLGGDLSSDLSTLTITDFVPTNIGLAPGVASTASANFTSSASASETSADASETASIIATDLAKRQLGVGILSSVLGEATDALESVVANATSVLGSVAPTGVAKRQDDSGLLSGLDLPTGVLSSVLSEATSEISSIVANATSALGEVAETGVAKRAADFSNARLTWYDIQTGNEVACGGKYLATDHVVALNSNQFGSGYPGPNCGRTITITANGKTATAKVVDKCPGCPYAGLDLTKGLFSVFASPDVGVLTGTWSFV